jgi:hypothetical protein
MSSFIIVLKPYRVQAKGWNFKEKFRFATREIMHLSAESIELFIEDQAFRCRIFGSLPAPFPYLPEESCISVSLFPYIAGRT